MEILFIIPFRSKNKQKNMLAQPLQWASVAISPAQPSIRSEPIRLLLHKILNLQPTHYRRYLRYQTKASLLEKFLPGFSENNNITCGNRCALWKCLSTIVPKLIFFSL